MSRKIITLALLTCLCSTVTSHKRLFQQWQINFTKVCNRPTAFNTCDSVTYLKFLKDDIEIYHDLGGLNIGTDYEMKSFREMCARGNHKRRELVKSTLEVYPIKGYGALEMGVHISIIPIKARHRRKSAEPISLCSYGSSKTDLGN